jgi:hypothetical protein
VTERLSRRKTKRGVQESKARRGRLGIDNDGDRIQRAWNCGVGMRVLVVAARKQGDLGGEARLFAVLSRGIERERVGWPAP